MREGGHLLRSWPWRAIVNPPVILPSPHTQHLPQNDAVHTYHTIHIIPYHLLYTCMHLPTLPKQRRHPRNAGKSQNHPANDATEPGRRGICWAILSSPLLLSRQQITSHSSRIVGICAPASPRSCRQHPACAAWTVQCNVTCMSDHDGCEV